MIRPVVLAVVLVAGLAGGNWWWHEGRFIQSTDNAYVQGDITVLGARVAGDVMKLYVTDNQAVKAGDPLIALDQSDLSARLDQIRAAAAEAEAALLTAHRQVDQSSAMIAQADAAILQAEAEQARATADAGRSRALVGSGWTSRQADDTAVATARKAAAATTMARAQRDSAQQAHEVAQAQIAQASARLKSAQAQIRLAENNLSYTVIRAPFDGIVGNRAAQLGQHVEVGQQLIAIAPKAEQLFVVANFKETQLRRMQAGQKVTITPDIDTGITGRVDSMAPATGALFSLLPPENATGNFTKVVQRVPVKIVFDAGQAAQAKWLRPGLSVTAEVDTRGPSAVRAGMFAHLLALVGL